MKPEQQLKESRRLARKYELNQQIAQILPRGENDTIYQDLADCYRRCELTVPSGFVLFLSDVERVEGLKQAITDKRVIVAHSPKADGKVVVVPRYK